MRLQMSAVVGTSLLLAACGGGKSSPADSSGDLAPSDTTASDLSDQGGSEELALSDREGSDLHPEVVPVPESFDVPAGGGMTVRVTTAPFGIVGLKGDKVVWDGSESPLAIGVVPKIDPLMRYDPEEIGRAHV